MEVKAGDTLFIIDPRTYQADYDRALANVALAKAHLERVSADYRRAEELLPRKAISQSDFDLAKGDRDEGAANVAVAAAALKSAKDYLDWTNVVTPISGRISRQMIDPGNMVKADDTLLTTVVSQDPIYAYFNVDERTSLEFRRMLEAGKVKSARDVRVPVWLGLVDEEGYPLEGTVNFVNNRLEPMTGTLQLRGLFANPKGFLAPGMFARIRVPVGTPHWSILVPEARWVRPGQTVPLRGRQGRQGRVSPGDGRGASRWAAGDRRGAVERGGAWWSAACSRSRRIRSST